VVNTASKCGFTPQYQGLETLYRKYFAQGFVVLGFPCNQFGAQEPGDAAEIAGFCSRTYNCDISHVRQDRCQGRGLIRFTGFSKAKPRELWEPGDQMEFFEVPYRSKKLL
jgi:glutathione peroxidase